MGADATWAAIGALGGGLGGITAVLALVAKPIHDIRRQGTEQAKRQDQFESDWYGEPARPGVDAKPGMMERVKGIEKELRPNGGSSLRDAVNETRAETKELRQAVDAHLRNHPATALPPVQVAVQPMMPAPVFENQQQ